MKILELRLITQRTLSIRVCNFPMKFSDREIARETEFPDRESREIGKYLCTYPETLFFLLLNQSGKKETTFMLALRKELDQR